MWGGGGGARGGGGVGGGVYSVFTLFVRNVLVFVGIAIFLISSAYWLFLLSSGSLSPV